MTGLLYTDEDGRTLQSGICEDRSHVLFQVTDGDAVADICVSKADLPSVVGALHEAAGLPAPVILERPDNPGVFLSLLDGFDFEICSGRVDVTRHATSTRSGVLLEPAVIRGIAAALALLAEDTEREPDPADVDELAMVLAEGNGAIGLDGARPLALRILRAGYRRAGSGE